MEEEKLPILIPRDKGQHVPFLISVPEKPSRLTPVLLVPRVVKGRGDVGLQPRWRDVSEE